MRSEKGIIISYNNVKGIGSIRTDSSIEVFFHVSSVNEKQVPFIRTGLKVEVDINMNAPKGPKAKKVKLLLDGKQLESKKESNESKSKAKYLLPSDTQKALPNRIDNNYLLIHKIVKTEKDGKMKWDRKFLQDANNNNRLIRDLNKRRHSLISSLEKDNYFVVSRDLKLDGKLAIGLGQPSVYETSLNLDFIYGVPFIPASTMKGLMRSWAINKYPDLDTEKVLGEQDERGCILILDSYPVGKLDMDLDVMNPHYVDYFTSDGGTPPTDDMNPNPITFPIVKNTAFQFTLLSKSMDTAGLNKWMDILEEALVYNGIGAKTSVGYGTFYPLEDMKEGGIVTEESLKALADKFKY